MPISRALRLFVLLTLIAFSCSKSEEAADTSRPEDNRFTTTVLTKPGELDEPMVIDFLPDGRVLFVERKGKLKSFNGTTSEVKTIATIPINTKYTSKEGDVREAEEGLMGLTVDPGYEKKSLDLHVLCRSRESSTRVGKMGAAWRLTL